MIALAPQLGTVVHVHQLRLNIQLLTELQHASGQHGAHLQLASDVLRIGVLSFVAEHGRPGHDPELRQFRELVDDRLGHAVREKFRLRIVARVDKREDGERVDRRADSRLAHVERHREGRQRRHNYNSNPRRQTAPRNRRQALARTAVTAQVAKVGQQFLR